MVFCIEERLGLRECRVDVDPAHAHGAGELLRGETGVEEPVVDGVDGVFGGGEGLRDLLGSPMFAEVGGFGVGDGHDVLLGRVLAVIIKRIEHGCE